MWLVFNKWMIDDNSMNSLKKYDLFQAESTPVQGIEDWK